MVALFLLFAAGTAAYSNSFHMPFLFDDFYGIVNNPNLRCGVPLLKLLSGSIRPVVEITFALNYRLGELDVRSYHAVNLLIHLLAAFTLYSLLHRTCRDRFLGFCTAAIWMLHPLQTQAVVYTIQRAECLMGLFYFLTLYSLRLSVDTPRYSRRWQGACVLCCLLGMGTKAGMITAPITALLYDRYFLANSFREALRIRRGFYLALFGTWIAAAALNLSVETAAQTFAQQGRAVSPLPYFLTQNQVILHYLRLSVWPRPLVFDYADWPLVHSAGKVLPELLLLTTLAAATVAAVLRRYRVGFLGAWFFLTLMPTSSFFPLPDPAFEFRMYLPLAALAGLLVFGAAARVRRQGFTAVLLLAIAAGLGAATFVRNKDYRSRTSLSNDTAAKRPRNVRAWNNLAAALITEGKPDEALPALQRALALNPQSSQANFILGQLHLQRSQWQEALSFFEKAVEAKLDFSLAHQSKGIALEMLGRDKEAFAAYSEALRISPELPEAHHGLGVLLARQERWREAAAEFVQAIRYKTDYALAYKNLGVAFTKTGVLQGAIHAYTQAVRLNPQDQESQTDLEQLLRGNNRR